MGDDRHSAANYLIAVYIVVPVLLIALLLLIVYIACSRRYKLNWFERSLLEEQSDGERYTIRPALRKSAGSLAGTRGGLKFGWPGGTAAARMGSTPSSPGSDVGEKFWVPPNVVERKRAQSLVPSLLYHGSEDEESTSGLATPSSIPGIREVTFTFPSEKLCGGSVMGTEMPSTPPPPQSQRRRASMHDAIDFTKIDTRLYDKKQAFAQQSVTSIQEENLGSLNFFLEYHSETSLLRVKIIQARDLVPRDFSSTANPYVKVCLLPGKRGQLQSKVHKNTVNPEFEEEFVFELAPQHVNESTLEMLMYDFDQFSRDEIIGYVHLSLEQLDLRDKVVLWKGISAYHQPKNKAQNLGDLMFSLSYLSSAERLTVGVIKARNIRHQEEGKFTMDPYVKVALVNAGKRLKKKKTSTKHNALNPMWNEALVFNLGREFIKNICVEFTLLHDNKLGNDEILAHIHLGPNSTGDEYSHWTDMVSAKCALARWHSLVS